MPGLRTNILIGVGSALFTLMSIEMAGPTGDPGRIAAQIVTGIGFLGAGAIMRTDSGIQGLTTAATVWVNAAVGVAAGGGKYHLAFIATGITLAALWVLEPIERVIARRFARPAKSDQARLPTRRTFRGVRGCSSGTAGRPASAQAAVIIDAEPVIESASRRSRIGRTFPKNIVKYPSS